MAATLTLTHAVIGTVDLLGASVSVAPGGFGIQTSDDMAWTTFEMVSRAADATFRTQMYGLEEMRVIARLWVADATRNVPVYLNWNNDGETARRTIVHDINYEVIPNGKFTALQGKNAVYFRISVLHPPFFESSVAETQKTEGSVSTLGGQFYYNVGGYGSIPGRISEFIFNDTVGTYTKMYSKIWIGIRDYRHGITDAQTLWEAELGTLSYDTTTASASAASSDGYLTTSFATDTSMKKRFTLPWSVVYTASASAESDICGRYLVLGRMKLSSATVECAVDLRYGWTDIADVEQSCGITYVSGVDNANLTNWNLIPLGSVEIPPTGDRDSWVSTTGGFFLSFNFVLYAERLSDAGSMDTDCFVLIPTDHLCIIKGAKVGLDGSMVDHGVYIITGDDDVSYAVNKSALASLGNVEYSFENWNYPRTDSRGGIVVIAAQASDTHEIGSQADVALTVYPRYLIYRYLS